MLGGFLKVALGLGAVVSIAGCGQVSQGTQVTSPPSGQATASAAQTPKPSASGFPSVGATIELAGENSGEKYQVTLTSIVDPASESDGMGLLPSGDRLVAVNLTIKNVGTGIQQESVADNVTLIDSAGHTYDGFTGIMYSVSQCQTFSGQITLPPGQSESGCVVFQVPTTAVMAKFQYIPDAGFASSLGEWSIG